MVEFSGKSGKGKMKTSKQLCYVAHDIDSVYLSRSACIDLGLIGDDFPTIGAFIDPGKVHMMSENKDNETYSAVNSLNKDKLNLTNDKSTCSCPKWETSHPIPNKELPFPATNENKERLGSLTRSTSVSINPSPS